jgi:hypothetical protein
MDTEERLPAPNGVSPFERIRRTNAAGAEYWSSRDFAQVLGYSDYRNFEQVARRAKTPCFNSGQRTEDHFVEITEMILDHMGSTELAANLFRATQTEEKLRRDRIAGKERANRTHFEVGAKVRKTIQELGGTMPENLPPAESIKKVESRRHQQPKVLEPPTKRVERNRHLAGRGRNVKCVGLTPKFS